ncbi:HD domain-containing protein [Acidianus brierleyi]|uniref:5'-deoxynucleotidase n=1 Tax=Acidianus brierleyi TaxID=41673 RepID=A0A2U9III7_9CREN|nr:HD family hydrolase [Acidianus brierleyi]AWR95849.1 HD domain-containing protein [Acidianus brierleyi]
MQLEKLLISCKNLVRTGWMQKGIPPSIGETVASHSFEAAILAFTIASKLKDKGVNVNPDHAAVIALFHDVGESILGDFPKWTSEKINKRDVELEAFKELGVGVDLFIEFKEKKTLESNIAKLSDRLSTVLQAKRYIKLGYDAQEIANSYLDEINYLVSTEPLIKIKDFVNNIIEKNYE